MVVNVLLKQEMREIMLDILVVLIMQALLLVHYYGVFFQVELVLVLVLVEMVRNNNNHTHTHNQLLIVCCWD
ncbi:MAG: hypothetical protein CL799_06510 [Chromatiales bacterium]|nr:hypothetical protein [Chromatiales bacterium]